MIACGCVGLYNELFLWIVKTINVALGGDRNIQGETQTDRDRDRETERQTVRETDRQTQRQRQRDR